MSVLITLTTGKNASTASHLSCLWVRLVSEEKQLSLRWGLLMQMSVCVLGERKGVCYCPQVMCYSETPRSLLRTEFTLIWHITSLSSKSRAFPQHPSGWLSRLYRHALRHGELPTPHSSCSRLRQLMSPVLLLWSQGRSHWWSFKDTVKGPERHTEKLEWKEEPRVLFCFVSGCGAIVNVQASEWRSQTNFIWCTLGLLRGGWRRTLLGSSLTSKTAVRKLKKW